MKAGRKALTTIAARPDTAFANMMAGLAFLAVLTPQMPLLAQGLDSSKAIDTIIGSDVKTEKESASTDRDRVMKAIDSTPEAISAVRKAFNLDRLEIVFLPDLNRNKALQNKIAEHSQEIEQLRDAIEGSAMFYHAVDSHGVKLDNIVAVSFTKDDQVRIYTAGVPEGE
jgi:hypothetical protein